jgi:hypothetical protein
MVVVAALKGPVFGLEETHPASFILGQADDQQKRQVECFLPRRLSCASIANASGIEGHVGERNGHSKFRKKQSVKKATVKALYKNSSTWASRLRRRVISRYSTNPLTNAFLVKSTDLTSPNWG